jgi:hypothetical protein
MAAIRKVLIIRMRHVPARLELLEEIGEENLFGDVDEALAAARAHLGLPPEELAAKA